MFTSQKVCIKRNDFIENQTLKLILLNKLRAFHWEKKFKLFNVKKNCLVIRSSKNPCLQRVWKMALLLVKIIITAHTKIYFQHNYKNKLLNCFPTLSRVLEIIALWQNSYFFKMGDCGTSKKSIVSHTTKIWPQYPCKTFSEPFPFNGAA
jgi:hypothetical protein